MYVASCQLTFRLRGVDSLKEKRAIVKRLIQRSRQKFPMAIAEVDAIESKMLCVLGVAVVSNSMAHLQSLVSEIKDHLETATDQELIGCDTVFY